MIIYKQIDIKAIKTKNEIIILIAKKHSVFQYFVEKEENKRLKNLE